MVDIAVVLWLFIILFGIIGFVRGWAREVLVATSVVIAYFIIVILTEFAPFVKDFFGNRPAPSGAEISMVEFWFKLVIIGVMVFLGYETPNIPRLAGNRFQRDNFRDSMLGLLLGAINGYLIVGTIWYLLDQANYPGKIVDPVFSETAKWWLDKLPPIFLMKVPNIFFMVAVAIVFIIAVFV